MKAMKGYKPTHRSPAAVEAAIAEANARAEILASYPEAELTAMGFDCSSYTDDAQRRAHFQNLRQEPIETILRAEFVLWDPVPKEEGSKKSEEKVGGGCEAGPAKAAHPKSETSNQPAFGTVEDKVVDDFALPVEATELGINGVARHLYRQLPAPPPAGVTS